MRTQRSRPCESVLKNICFLIRNLHDVVGGSGSAALQDPPADLHHSLPEQKLRHKLRWVRRSLHVSEAQDEQTEERHRMTDDVRSLF